MLNNQVRQILTWLTILNVVVVIASGMASAVRVLAGTAGATQALDVQPGDVTLCAGERIAFAVAPSLEDVDWAATGGTIAADGSYTAGDLPGNYEVQAAGPERARGRALVSVAACTPTPPPTPTAIPTPLPTPTPAPTPIAAADPQGDVGAYSTGAPVAAPFTGVDVRNASVAADGRIDLLGASGTLSELAGWAQPGESVLWISLYDPIPATLPVRTDWLFVLDLDGNTATGRPAGSRPINLNLGDEAAVGVYYDPLDTQFYTYLLVWDTAAGAFAQGADIVRYWISPDRTLIALAAPLNTLQQEVTRTAGVAVAPETARGRAAVISYTVPEAAADFYP